MIGILSDAHGNIAAFQNAISALRFLGASKFYFLGDALGYIPSVGVLQELMDMGSEVKCILGNHELMVLNECEDNCESIYNHLTVRRQMTSEHLAFLKSWPSHRRETIGKSGVLFVHGSPYDFSNEYVYPDSDVSQFKVSEQFVFMGHTHYPFIKIDSGVTFVNVGSCGLPRDDGRFGSCATFDPQTLQVGLYRFAIANLADVLTPSQLEAVHPSVIRLTSRRADDITGKMLFA